MTELRDRSAVNGSAEPTALPVLRVSIEKGATAGFHVRVTATLDRTEQERIPQREVCELVRDWLQKSVDRDRWADLSWADPCEGVAR